MKSQMSSQLGDPQAPFNKELFESICTAFEQCYDIWKVSTMVTNVLGTGPVPIFAPPFVPVGPVVMGTGIDGPRRIGLMPAQGRLGDPSNVRADAHGCPACPHPAVGPAISGSPDVNCNSRPALRVGDNGVHAACCGPNTWVAAAGSGTVFINNQAGASQRRSRHALRRFGQLVDGSENVMVGG